MKRNSDDAICILSNNHVLANINAGRIGDPILCPGVRDGGAQPSNCVGDLRDFVPLQLDGQTPNYVDCAIASVGKFGWNANEVVDPQTGKVMATLKATTNPSPHIGMPVAKVGRTTGFTQGEVVVLEIDGLRVTMDAAGHERTAIFNGQILVANRHRSFSKPGDSGSIVFDANGAPTGLLFAGSQADFESLEFGSDLGRYAGSTFVNPIDTVLSHLDCKVFVG